MTGQDSESALAMSFLRRIYDDGETKISIPKSDRNEIWANFRDSSSVNQLLKKFPKIEPVIHALETARAASKNLQSAILSECVYTYDLAYKLGLRQYSEFEKYSGTIPNFAETELNNLGMVARFIYFNTQGSEFIIQAGGPNAVDACYISSTEQKILWIEYKEPAAKYGEADLLYDDEGFLKTPPKFLTKHKNFEAMLNHAKSQELNIFEYSHKKTNFTKFNQEMVSSAIVQYFQEPANTVVFTEDENSNLIGLLSSHIPKFASRIEGEIRSAGRNPKRLFTKNHFGRVFTEMGGVVDASGHCRISKDKVTEFRTARGDAGKITGIKITSLYFIRLTDLFEVENNYEFALGDVYQLKSSIASKAFLEHVKIETIKNFYLD